MSAAGQLSPAAEAGLDLHTDFYPAHAVERAAAAFAAVARCALERRGAYHHVRLSARDGSPAGPLLLRFANYALASAAVPAPADPAAAP